MFDNPKKELERLQEQLLAVEAHDPVEDFDDFSDDTFCASDPDDTLDDDLYAVLYDDRDFARRSAGFEEAYVMDTDRYVPAPKKRGIGKFLFFFFLVLLAAAALIAWRQGWLK